MSQFYLIPPVYREGGGPLRWQDEQSGVLVSAMKAYFAHHTDGTPFSYEQLTVVRAWGQYYLNAPCWDANPAHDEQSRAALAHLRAQIAGAATVQDIDAWLDGCLEIGIDPF